MKIFLASTLTRATKREDLNKTMPIKNHLESYFYLRHKESYLKELKNDNTDK